MKSAIQFSKRLKTGLWSTFLILIIIFLTVKFCVYNPFYNYEQTEIIYTLLSQVLYPDMFLIELDQNNSNSFFSIIQNQKVKLSKTPYYGEDIKQSDIIYQGNVKYTLNRVDAEIENLAEISENIFSQSFYINPETIEKPTKIKKGKYLFYYTIDRKQTLEDLFSKIQPFFDQQGFSDWEEGVYWIPVRTSEEREDITLGIRGNLRVDFSVNTKTTSGVMWEYHERQYSEQGEFFINSLKTLSAKSREITLIQSNPIFGKNVAGIDFNDRYQYVLAHGCEPLGIVLYGDQDFLNNDFLQTMNLIKIQQL